VPRILVADDNSNIQKMVALALEEQGIDVVSVGNGEAAVRRIPDLAPDLILADVFMPVRNGYEVCEFVKKDDRFAHVPVILLVGAFDPLDEKEARRVGADGVLKKPFVPPDPLIAMVTSALEKNPKVAAEMARQRETPPPKPPEPEIPVAALEPPARTAPKPLPEFPEPSPEEADLVYGFKKKPAKSDSEDASPRFAHQPDETEEEFDDSTTASDWRRNAANFEVPEELGAKPAFSTDEDFGPVVFPSERDLPPKHYPLVDAGDDDATTQPARSFEPAPMEADGAPEAHEAPAERFAPAAESPAAEPSSYFAHGSPAGAPAHEAEQPSEYSEESWVSSIFGKFRRKAAREEEADQQRNGFTTPAPEFAEPSPAIGIEEHTESVAARDERSQRSGLDSWFSPHPGVLDGDASEDAASSAFSSESAENLMSAPADSTSPRNSGDAPRAASGPAGSPSSGFPWAEVHSMSSEFDSSAQEPHPAEDETTSGQASHEFSPSSSHRDHSSDSSLHAFLPPAPPVEGTPDAESADDPAAHDAPAGPFFAPASLASMAENTGEAPPSTSEDRIPTAPPPNREALAGIPFLTPSASTEGRPAEAQSAEHSCTSCADESAAHEAPASGSSESRDYSPAGWPASESCPPNSDATEASSAANRSSSSIGAEGSRAANAPAAGGQSTSIDATAAPSVDAVVSRLLEKLEPRLHQMLAKDVLKPLVEDLLNQELANKK
jgi:CheY-like chemotaxis protein